MWSHTRSLEVLMMAGTVAPAELVRVATMARPGTGGRDEAAQAVRRGKIGVPTAYSLVCLLAISVAASGHFAPRTLTTWGVSGIWLLFAVGVGVAVVALEIGVGFAVSGARTFRFRVDLGAGSADAGFLMSITATAIAEELLYRGLWVGTLHQRLGLASAAAVACAAVAYALGHLFFGPTVVGQKAVTGAVFGTVLVVSGSLLVPLIAHVTQNLTVFGLASRQAAAG